MRQRLDQLFWDTMYTNQTTGWDMGRPAPLFVEFVNQIENKEVRILIPGAGNAHEADYLLEQGFKNISIVDVSSVVIGQLEEKFKQIDGIKLNNEDFFEHHGTYDFIFEQTFFCALDPKFRTKYVKKMDELLGQDGVLFGVLFNRVFPSNPPFGGNKKLYHRLFSSKFQVNKMEKCYNSHPARQGSELWINLAKKSS